MDQKLRHKNSNLGHFGGVLTPFDARGSKIRFSPGSRVIKICVYQFCQTLWEVSEKFNGWIKSYGAKSVIFGHFGVFWGVFDPFDPPMLKIRFFPGSRVIKICVHQFGLSFWEVPKKFNGWIKSYRAKSSIFGYFGPFWGVFDPI